VIRVKVPQDWQSTRPRSATSAATINPLGVKGLGEIGIVGVVAAIANAVYHATEKRVRDLPITVDKLRSLICLVNSRFTNSSLRPLAG